MPNDFVEPFPEFRRTIRPTIWLAFRRANFVSARSHHSFWPERPAGSRDGETMGAAQTKAHTDSLNMEIGRNIASGPQNNTFPIQSDFCIVLYI